MSYDTSNTETRKTFSEYIDEMPLEGQRLIVAAGEIYFWYFLGLVFQAIILNHLWNWFLIRSFPLPTLTNNVAFALILTKSLLFSSPILPKNFSHLSRKVVRENIRHARISTLVNYLFFFGLVVLTRLLQ